MENLPVPHQRHSDTSRESAELAQKKFPNNLLKVLASFSVASNTGQTDEEGMIANRMMGNSYRPSRVTLEKRGYLVRLDATRPTQSGRRAHVYVITMLGEMELSRHD